MSWGLCSSNTFAQNPQWLQWVLFAFQSKVMSGCGNIISITGNCLFLFLPTWAFRLLTIVDSRYHFVFIDLTKKIGQLMWIYSWSYCYKSNIWVALLFHVWEITNHPFMKPVDTYWKWFCIFPRSTECSKIRRFFSCLSCVVSNGLSAVQLLLHG